MEPINNVERIALLLREKLAERAKASRGNSSSAASRQPTAPSSVAALAALGDVDERQFRRTVIQSVLVDHFGRGVMNDAAFQQVVEQVFGVMEAEEGARNLLDRAVRDLKAR
ncbi:hypothetical protein SAMN05518801_1404 [Novosphingobium sp. CF614]|uniref:hypothetical protein n=1 Tax=Novosphingobium sp. CF614 TaxID=1884364 RepID=UPI0008F40662|nr:hypothetical protein [Novosphingobium sp. CF614]SFG52075.1 hypothetical protein SAMN05518801_1404 [Novosphingobium sp. CF614]